jgi:hypothetical protein
MLAATHRRAVPRGRPPESRSRIWFGLQLVGGFGCSFVGLIFLAVDTYLPFTSQQPPSQQQTPKSPPNNTERNKTHL